MIKTPLSQIRYFVQSPVGPLRRYVREILWVRSEQPRVQILLPETTLTLVLRQAGSAWIEKQALPNAIVSGLQQRARVVEHAAGSSLVILRFTEVGAPAILHDRADLLYNRTVGLLDLLPRQEIDDLQNILADTREIKRQVSALETFLTWRLESRGAKTSRAISPQIEEATRMIRNSDGRASIQAVARQVAMSQSALERQFRAAVGASPKSLARLARLQHVCRLWDSGKRLTEISFEAGYCDQPHFVHDFRRFTNRSPEEFFASTSPRNLPIFYK